MELGDGTTKEWIQANTQDSYAKSTN
jgi:hypothetical protein